MKQVAPEDYAFDDEGDPAEEYLADRYRWLPAPALTEPEHIKKGPKARYDKLMHQAAYLAAFAETGNKRLACGAAKVSRTSVWNWESEEGADGDHFRASLALATEQAVETLEAEARRRAVHGTRKVKRTFFKGELVDERVEIDYSDTLLIFLLKGAAPDKYADRSKVDITHKIEDIARQLADETGEPYEVVLAEVSNLSSERTKRRSA